MKAFCAKWLLTLAVIHICLQCSGQEKNLPPTVWTLPGVSYQVSPKFSLLDQLGYNSYQRSKIIFTQGFYQANKYLSIGSGYLFFIEPVANKRDYVEHDVVNTLTVTIPISHFILEDRNMLLNTFSDAAKDHFYRNRMRLSFPFKVDSNSIKIYAYNEEYYFTNDGRWSRNRIGTGCGYDLTTRVNLDVSYVRQKDIFSGNLNLVFVMLTIQIKRGKAI
jgi:Protein of unknown function (DUF2490)